MDPISSTSNNPNFRMISLKAKTEIQPTNEHSQKRSSYSQHKLVFVLVCSQGGWGSILVKICFVDFPKHFFSHFPINCLMSSESQRKDPWSIKMPLNLIKLYSIPLVVLSMFKQLRIFKVLTSSWLLKHDGLIHIPLLRLITTENTSMSQCQNVVPSVKIF